MRSVAVLLATLCACQTSDKLSEGSAGSVATSHGTSSTQVTSGGFGNSGGTTAPATAFATSGGMGAGTSLNGPGNSTRNAPAAGSAAGGVGSAHSATGSVPVNTGGSAISNTLAKGGESAASTGTNAALGPYPAESSSKTGGGTMTFTNIGAAGWWPRRIDRPAGDPACTYKDGSDTWGGQCCMREQYTTSTTLSPFDQELTLILKAINVKQLAIYQPSGTAATASWSRVSAWDARTRNSVNLWFTQQGAGSTTFPGDLSQTDCVGYVMQEPRFDCGDGRDYYCPDDPGILHRGYAGSKLIVLLASMTFSDQGVKACGSTALGKPAPWVALVASELVRDGGRKWNGLCNCYSKTGSVGDGCGEINVFEVVMDNNDYSNREFISTGVRSYQVGHLGGAVAGAKLAPSTFVAEAEVVDACAKTAYSAGPELVAGGATDGCPIWRRPTGDRFFFILLDEATRTIQVGIIHPSNVPSAAAEVLPNLPASVSRDSIDAMIRLRLPS